MRVFVALASGSRPIPARIGDVERRATEIALPAESGPWRRHEWRSRDDRVVLIAWSNEPEDPRLIPPLLTGGERALGCAGYLGDSADAYRLLVTEAAESLADDLPGVFGVFRADQQGFVAVTTAVRVDPVYYATAGDIHIAGNRALLVHLIARAEEEPLSRRPDPRYDLLGLHSFVRHGFFLGDGTPFEGVQALPAHSSLEVRDGERRIRARPLPRVEPVAPKGQNHDAFVRELVDGLLASVAPLRTVAEPVRLSLTGGRDSRLVAAILHAAGIPFRTVTRGFPEHPDVLLAAQIAQLLGVPHHRMPPQQDKKRTAVIADHPLRRAWRIVRLAEGMLAAYHNMTHPVPFRAEVRLNGIGGEQLRAGYLAYVSDPSPRRVSAWLRGQFMRCEQVMTDVANQRAEEELAPWLERAAQSPALVPDIIYLYYRTGRWAGAPRAVAMMSSLIYYPLLDNRLNRLALATPPDWRQSERMMHEAISQLAPQLRDLPLTGKRWRFERDPPRGPFARARWAARRAIHVDSGPAAFDWRFDLTASLVALLREQILGGPTELFHLVRRDKMEELLSSSLVQQSKQSKFIWQAFTVSVLLSNLWLSGAPDLASLTIPIPSAGSSPSALARRAI